MYRPMSVDERVKLTGFASGPGNRTVDQMAQEADAPSDEPPNLRDSGVMGSEGRCSSCMHYEDDQCTKYAYPCKPYQTCDSFQEEGEDGGEMEDDGMEGGGY